MEAANQKKSNKMKRIDLIPMYGKNVLKQKSLILIVFTPAEKVFLTQTVYVNISSSISSISCDNKFSSRTEICTLARFYKMSFNAEALRFPWWNPNLFQHDNDPGAPSELHEHTACWSRSQRTHGLLHRTLTSASSEKIGHPTWHEGLISINALVAEWAQFPIATLQHLAIAFPQKNSGAYYNSKKGSRAKCSTKHIWPLFHKLWIL